MPFAPVKSNPYSPKRCRRTLGPLWPEAVWKRMCDYPVCLSWKEWLPITVEANANLPERYRRKQETGN